MIAFARFERAAVAAPPPPKPSPIEGEGFCAVLDEDHVHRRAVAAPIGSLFRKPSPSMGEGWEGVMSLAPQVSTRANSEPSSKRETARVNARLPARKLRRGGRVNLLRAVVL